MVLNLSPMPNPVPRLDLVVGRSYARVLFGLPLTTGNLYSFPKVHFDFEGEVVYFSNVVRS